MNKNNKDKKELKNSEVQFEEMEQVDEFSTMDFVKGAAVGIAIGSAVVLLT